MKSVEYLSLFFLVVNIVSDMWRSKITNYKIKSLAIDLLKVPLEGP